VIGDAVGCPKDLDFGHLAIVVGDMSDRTALFST
jgi:hypothetical protein